LSVIYPFPANSGSCDAARATVRILNDQNGGGSGYILAFPPKGGTISPPSSPAPPDVYQAAAMAAA